MDRSLYEDGAEITERQLQRTEDTRAFHILQRFIATSQMGVEAGLAVSVNVVNTSLIDIAAGTGYAPNGEYIELIQPLTQQALPTSALDVVVGLVYTEVESDPIPHTTSSTIVNSKATRSVRVSILTPDDFLALPLTDDDLSNDALDRFLIVSLVSTTGGLTITNPPDFKDPVLTVTQPTEIPGLVIIDIDETTPNSDPAPNPGTIEEIQLRFDPSSGELEYQAPHDTGGFGTPVIVTSGGPNFQLASDNLKTIDIEVTAALLPESGSIVTDDTAFVARLYDKVANRESADDRAHRSLLGGRTPSPENPHGSRLQNIATLVDSVPGQVEFGTELDSTFAARLTARMLTPNVTPVPAGSNAFTLLWEIPGSGSVFGPFTVRFYGSSTDSLVITVNARFFEDSTPTQEWRRDTTGTSALKFEIAGAAMVLYQHIASDPDTWDDVDWDVNEFHSTSTNRLDLTGSLIVGVNKLASDADVETSRITTHYSHVSGQIRTKIWESRGITNPVGPVFDSGESAMAIYRVFGTDGIYTSDSDSFELVRNAVWDEGASTWSRVGGASFASKLLISNERIAMFQRTGGGSWADSAWDSSTPSLTFGTSGALALPGDVNSAGDYNYTSPKTIVRSYGTNHASIDPATSGDGSDVFTKGAGLTVFHSVSWPLHLPDGAVLTAVDAFINLTNNGGQVTGQIRRRANTGGALSDVAVATVFGDTGAGINIVPFTAPTNPNNIINNTTHTYHVRMFNTSIFDEAWSMNGIRISYTIAGLGK